MSNKQFNSKKNIEMGWIESWQVWQESYAKDFREHSTEGDVTSMFGRVTWKWLQIMGSLDWGWWMACWNGFKGSYGQCDQGPRQMRQRRDHWHNLRQAPKTRRLSPAVTKEKIIKGFMHRSNSRNCQIIPGLDLPWKRLLTWPGSHHDLKSNENELMMNQVRSALAPQMLYNWIISKMNCNWHQIISDGLKVCKIRE